MQDDALLSALFPVLDMAVFEWFETAPARVVGMIPAWFQHLFPEALAGHNDLRLAKTSPFLENFLIDAAVFWHRREAGRLHSGTWDEVDKEGQHYALTASAVCVGNSNILSIERLGAAYEETRTFLQTAREHRLEYYRLAREEHVLRTSHDDLLSILNRLQLGTAMTDEEGRITFLSQGCQRFFDTPPEDVLGQHWEVVSPFTAAAKDDLKAMAGLPPDERTKLQSHIERFDGRHFCVEIDIQDDPRDARRKIICFYDMTEVYDLRRLLDSKAQFHDLVGRSEPMLQIYEQIRDVARVDTTVLIEGDTGTGKELVARAIHDASHRSGKPFLAVNCAGLTESLLTSQLFGHRRGAFTGAVSDHLGVFEAARGGTLFLDEIGDIPLSVQTSLLRVLQEREITRLGESIPRKIDVRILTATHHNLHDQVANAAFRADLFYRIRVARLHLPALRQRRQDIPLLAQAFLGQCRATMGKSVQDVSHDAMRCLLDYDWPGNVRELKSAIEYAVIHCRGAVLLQDDLPPEFFHAPTSPRSATVALPQDDKQRFLTALEHAQGNRTVAARLLGISRATFYRRLATLGISSDA